jgi:hypothetical protein
MEESFSVSKHINIFSTFQENLKSKVLPLNAKEIKKIKSCTCICKNSYDQ